MATTDGYAKSWSAEVEELLKRLAEVSTIETWGTADVEYLDPRTRSLAVIGAAICTDAPARTFQSLVTSALQAGATAEEVLGVLLAVAPTAGEPRVVTAAPRIALALGYDVDAAFEIE